MLRNGREGFEAHSRVLEALSADDHLVRDAVVNAAQDRANRRYPWVAWLDGLGRRLDQSGLLRLPHPPALGDSIAQVGDLLERARGKPAVRELLQPVPEPLAQVRDVARSGRLAVQLAVLLGELADVHLLERGELRRHIADQQEVRVRAFDRLHRGSLFASIGLARRAHDGFFPGGRQGENQRFLRHFRLRSRRIAPSGFGVIAAR